MNPFFSICIPVYNQAGKMGACVASLKGQRFPDFEAILVDDGSSDGSWEEIMALAAADARFRGVQHERNSGLLAARFTGMANAKGEAVLFLDSDDWLSQDALETLHQAFADKNVDIVRFGYVDEPGGEKHPAPDAEDALSDILQNKIAPGICKNAYRISVIREALKRAEPFYCNMAEDLFLSGVFFSCVEKERVKKLDAFLHHYDRGTGMSSPQASFTAAKLRRDFDSISAVGEHLLPLIETYRPACAALARSRVDASRKYLLFEHIVFNEDWDRVKEILMALEEPWLSFACDRLLPYKIKRQLGLINRENGEAAYWKMMGEPV